MLSYGANPNTSIGANPLLFVVAENGNLEIIKMLVENGAEVDATDSRDQTALQRASMKGHIAIVAYLLDHHANVHHTDKDGVTAILLAAHAGFTGILQLLIDRGADPQRPSSKGWMPLHLCYGHPETTNCLLKEGADVNSFGKYSHTPLYLAASQNHPEVVKVLLSYNPDLEITLTHACSENNDLALTAATARGHVEVIRLLLEAGANINCRSRHNNFPLQIRRRTK